jgi:hypothetical protein
VTALIHHVRATALFATQNLLNPRQAAEIRDRCTSSQLGDELPLVEKIERPAPTLGSSMAKPRERQSKDPSYSRSIMAKLERGGLLERKERDGEFSKVERVPG